MLSWTAHLESVEHFPTPAVYRYFDFFSTTALCELLTPTAPVQMFPGVSTDDDVDDER